MARWLMVIAVGLMGVTMGLAAEQLHFTNGRVLRDGHLVNQDLFVEGGRIVDGDAAQEKATVVDLKGRILAPGYIDLQLNGGFGFDFTVNPETVPDVAKLLPQCGVTAFLPTIITSESAGYRRRGTLSQVSDGAEALGWHLEGPFISHDFSGMHPKQKITKESIVGLSDVVEMYGTLDDVSMITLAPERVRDLSVVRQLVDQGVVVSVGHTAATEKEFRACVAAGASMVTHLFNAMRGLHHREPGVVGTVLADRSLHYGLIIDGHHVADTAVALAYSAHPRGMVLVTDSMQAMGLPEGVYTLGGEQVSVKGGRAVLSGQNTLAGSTCTLDAAVRRLVKATGCDVTVALEAASLRPAEAIGVADRKGKLEVGYDADLIVLDDALNVQSCYVKGVEVTASAAMQKD